ncbi:MAG TPA: hypothetical protein VGR02_12395 [Thermoanaerobaculia bacterium]|nr:hypothetical protein [Thermoanaerobaculia bacterium]
MSAAGEPVADPHDVNIWRDDQHVSWKLLLPDEWGWSHSGPGGENGGVVLSRQWVAAGGSPAVPRGLPPSSGPDRRLYSAHGPGPATTTKETFSYDIYVQGPDGQTRSVQTIPVDPDISNQPQP